MARYQVILTYDGTDFLGFQRQGNSLRTVQGVVEDALRKLGWNESTIFAAGRTDTGVHATGQVIAFDLAWAHGERDLQSALNANLPYDVAARAVRQVSSRFHPRYDALWRHYRYRLFCQQVREPLRERYAWRVRPSPAVTLLEQAAGYLVGVHDFAAFGAPPRPEGTTIREVKRAVWQFDGDELAFDIIANAFLIQQGGILPNIAALLEPFDPGVGRRRGEVDPLG